jgi:hypothetical protein
MRHRIQGAKHYQGAKGPLLFIAVEHPRVLPIYRHNQMQDAEGLWMMMTMPLCRHHRMQGVEGLTMMMLTLLYRHHRMQGVERLLMMMTNPLSRKKLRLRLHPDHKCPAIHMPMHVIRM